MQILLVKIGALGDATMVLPLAKKIREDFPEASLTWMGGKGIKELIASMPFIDTYKEVDDGQLFQGNPLSKCFALLKVWIKNAFQRYDRIYLLHPDTRYSLLLWGTFSKMRFQCTRRHFPRDQYHALSYLHMYDPAITQVTYPSISIEENKKPRVALLPGGAKNVLREQSLKRWPLEHYVVLAKKLLSLGVEVVLLGSSLDRWVLPAFEQLPIVDNIGKTTLRELMGEIDKATLFITHDSGPLHLAKLTQTKTIALFGPTSEQVFAGAPYSKNILPLTLIKRLSCQPCYDGKYFAACTSNKCLQSISPEEVFEKIQRTSLIGVV